MSMVGLSMFHAFCQRCKHVLKPVRIILVGDPDQLPSIQCGAVLRDLRECIQTTVTLTKCHRTKDNRILENANKIRRGIVNLEYNDSFCKVNDCNPFLQKVAQNPEECKIICYSRKEVQHYNEQVQAIRLKKGLLGAAGKTWKIAKATYHVNDIVINCQNIYAEDDRQDEKQKYLKIANGEEGKISAITNDTITVQFADSEHHYVKDDNDVFLLAYALTCHKAQGSGYKEILGVLPTYLKEDTRKFVYTMVTRAKTKVLLFDPFDKMKTYIAQANTVDRRTRLDYYIKK
jgi:exodeoxyribonuclease V alpha subunit